MKKIGKIFLWITGIVIIFVIIMSFLGFEMQSQAEKFITKSGFSNASATQINNNILCPNGAAGIVVYGDVSYETKKEGRLFPVCVTITGKTSLGTWSK